MGEVIPIGVGVLVSEGWRDQEARREAEERERIAKAAETRAKLRRSLGKDPAA